MCVTNYFSLFLSCLSSCCSGNELLPTENVWPRLWRQLTFSHIFTARFCTVVVRLSTSQPTILCIVYREKCQLKVGKRITLFENYVCDDSATSSQKPLLFPSMTLCCRSVETVSWEFTWQKSCYYSKIICLWKNPCSSMYFPGPVSSDISDLRNRRHHVICVAVLNFLIWSN